VRTIAELDVELQELDRLAAISDDALRQGFTKFRLELSLDMPSDPWSPEYRAKVFETYELVHGKPYGVVNEVTDAIDLKVHVGRPFPYITESCDTVAHQLIAIGHVIRTLELKPGSRVLELGSGWANPALALAQMGHHVTAVDIAANFVDLAAERAASIGLSIDARQGDFAIIKELDPGFDAVLFYEAFHHAADHLDVIASLDRIVAPGGKVLFAAEPIFDELPYPWGLRLDGESAWAIRQNGWLELGFQPDYFEQALRRYGWTLNRSVQAGTVAGVIYTARRTAELDADPAAAPVS
jgi:protein-L-isoaspartate O-methyltransferase